MATVLDKTVQGLADASGIIVDRSVTPEKVIGQGWIISKSRMLVLASSVANYADAPWALLVKFPYPDLVYSVKAISLHPEFNRRAAREHYLAQSVELNPSPLNCENDIATITIDAEIPDLQPDRVQELNRALALPLTISAQDLSGVLRAGDTGNVLQQAIASQRNGVLNFYDERKVPFCRILIIGGRIVKATYQNLQNEFAVCELMWRKPGGNFVLQSDDGAAWKNIPDIAMGTADLAKEATRRTQDLPRMLDSLGGPNVRYVRTQQNIDLNQMNQQIRWVVERVWPVLDGSLPLTKMSERLGVDTYTAMQAIWEMKNAGLIAMANFEQYHRSGQLGPALVPGHDVDLNFWDNLQGFYLDELSTGPVTMQGNYFGSTHLLQPTTLLHTMSVASKYGAVVLKEGRLVGLHNGKFMANLSSPPPFPLSKMAWIGTLSDMSAKRMRAATAELETDLGEEGLGVRGALTGAKARQILSSAAEVLTNSAPPPSEIGGPLVPSNEPEVLRKFNKIQMGVGGAGLGLVIGMIFAVVFMSPKTPVVVPVPAVQPSQSSSATGTGTGDAAPKVAPSGELFKQTLRLTAVKDIPIGDFKFVDTSKDTGNKPSFGLESESLNQRIIFVVWPDIRIQASVDNNMSQPPFIPVKALVDIMSTKDSARGSLPFRDFYYRVHHYYNTSDKDTMAFVAAYTSNEPDKSVLIVAMPLKGEGQLDYLNTINMVQRMININSGDAASNAAGNNGSTAAPVVATAEDIQAYRQKVGDIIKAVYKNPADADRASTKCQVKFVIDSTGNISKLELKYTAGMDEVDKAVQKAITSSVPFPPPPSGIRGGQAEMLVTLEPGASELTISEP